MPPSGDPAHNSGMGTKLATLWFAGWHSIHWATPARALLVDSVLEDYMFLEICPFHPGFQISWHIVVHSWNFLFLLSENFKSSLFLFVQCSFPIAFYSYFVDAVSSLIYEDVYNFQEKEFSFSVCFLCYLFCLPWPLSFILEPFLPPEKSDNPRLLAHELSRPKLWLEALILRG